MLKRRACDERGRPGPRVRTASAWKAGTGAARLQDASSMCWRVETRTMVSPKTSYCSSSSTLAQVRAMAMSLRGTETCHGRRWHALRGTPAPLRGRGGWHDDALRQGDACAPDCAHTPHLRTPPPRAAVHVEFPPSRNGKGAMAIMARLRSERQAPCTAHRREWSEATSRVLPHSLQPGTHLVAQFGNDQAVLKVIPAGQSGKLDRGAQGSEMLDRLGSVLDGHPPVGLAVHHIQRQVPQVVERDLPGRARDGNRRHKVRAERGGQMPGPPAAHAVAHHRATPGIYPEVLLHRGQRRKGRGFPGGRGPAALIGRGGHQQGGEAAEAGEGNQVQKAAAIKLARLPPKVQAEDHRERRT